MVQLDPSHELTGRPELPDLPPPGAHHRKSWSWLFAAVVAVVVSFTLALALLAAGYRPSVAISVVILTFVFSLFFVHTAAEKAR